MLPTQDEIWSRLRHEGIVSPEDAAALEAKRTADGPANGGAEAVLTWLMERQIVTPYQAGLLLGPSDRPLHVGAYLLRDRVLEGRLAGTYQATHRQLNFPVGLLLLEPYGSPAEIQARSLRLQREARISAQLNHPNLVKTYQVGRDPRGMFVAFEYLQGQSLGDLLTANSVMETAHEDPTLKLWDEVRGTTRVAVVCRLFADAAAGLAHAHELGIVHRNLSADNIWVCKGGPVKVLDFGLARDGLGCVDPPHVDRLLSAGEEFLGNTDCLAPEQGLGDVTPAPNADVYALGCTLYYALAGRLPFEAGTPGRQMLMHALRTASPPSEHNPTVPPELDALVLRMMSKRPEDRPQTAREVFDALQPFLNDADELLRHEPPNEALDDFLKWLAEQPAGEAPTAS